MKVVLTEKPSVARDLARILKANKRCEGYFEGTEYLITWAFGHLVELCEPHEYDPIYQKWNLNHLPILPEEFKLKVSSNKGVKQQFNIIKKLFKSAKVIICATDSGREGELIFRYIQQLCKVNNKQTFRLWLNSLTDQAIVEGFSKLKPISEYDSLANAARARSEADWIIGMNATRAFTIKYSQGRGVFSLGRVQTPVLALIVKRDREIKNFIPEDYWELWTIYKNVKFKHTKDRFKKHIDAEDILKKIQGQSFEIVNLEEKNISIPPPFLFDLTELQRTMNKSFGFTATQTLSLCQNLYEKKLISYPRTDSRFLTEDLFSECSKIFGKLKALYENEINEAVVTKSKRVFDNSKVKDHHAIIPTGLISHQLSKEESIIFQAICKRMIAVFYPPCKKMQTIVHGVVSTEKFVAKGTRILSLGWYALYQNEKKEEKEEEEQNLPSFIIGENGNHQPEIKTCKTKPPQHYTEGTLLSAMETAGKVIEDEELKEAIKEKGLGTPATRAAIIETLLKREYISKDKKKILSTSKGQELISLFTHDFILASSEMTAEWEYKLKQIESGKMESSQFMKEIHLLAKKIIGSVTQKQEVNINNLGLCPLCSSPVIKGNTGFGCSSWKGGCLFRFHAHQEGIILESEDVLRLLKTKGITKGNVNIKLDQDKIIIQK